MGDLRYADAGVNAAESQRAAALIRRTVASTHGPEVLSSAGGYSGLFRLERERYRDCVLVSSADSVGTKVKVATAVGRHRGIGVDLVNHCVNDILCCGAEPLFFLDYFATGKLAAEQLAEIIEGVASACRDSGCALLGGETAEMTGLYALGDYDIAGFAVGAVERDAMITGEKIEIGDRLLGLPSSGLHTNGYSLVRHIVANEELDWASVLPGTDSPLADLLLEPHRGYTDAVRELRLRVDVRGLAHVTGGGLLSNAGRILPEGRCAEIDRTSWTIPPIFAALEQVGGIHPDEMWTTFNMGIGMVAVIPAAAPTITQLAGLPVVELGNVVQAGTAERAVLR